MKLLLFNGTPHKGNTWSTMCIIKEEILKINPRVEFTEIHLNETNLPFCTGCSLCFRKGKEYCPHYQIIKDIYEKMEECEGIIFGATTFNMAPNALTKNFIDHLCFHMHRPHFFTKKALVVSTTGGVFASKTVKYIAGSLNAMGFNRCYKLPLSAYSWNNYKPSKKGREQIHRTTHKFYQDLVSGKLHSPSIGIMISYNMFRGMSQSYIKGTEYETEDGNYWSNPVRKKITYAPEISVPFYKRPFGHLFFLIGKQMGKNIIVTYKK